MLRDSLGIQYCVTCELPWNNNHPQISCIPAGTYHCIPHNSPAHPNTWEITGVPNRSEILIHNANLPSQLLGCVGVGKSFGYLGGKMAVMQSVAALTDLRTKLPAEFDLTITDDFNKETI